MKKAILVLEDGTVFRGIGFGKVGKFRGELVFNTAMTGYIEALTDPSYAGQILTFAYPLIGNYGATFQWSESKKIQALGIVVSEFSEEVFHRDSKSTLKAELENGGIGGIAGIDTRMLIRKIRSRGTTEAILMVYSGRLSEAEQVKKLLTEFRAYPKIDLVKQVTRKSVEIVNPSGNPLVAVIDYGVKEAIIQELAKRGLKILIFSATVTIEEIRKYSPKGVVLSNGPGNPQDFSYAIKTISDLLSEQIPIFGICLGHQLLALAIGGKTYKLKFGHRGINHPIIGQQNKSAYLTSQNHGYAVLAKGIPKDWEISFWNLNDRTVEGLRHKYLPVFSVQFHPEASPGPRDTQFLFEEFVNLL